MGEGAKSWEQGSGVSTIRKRAARRRNDFVVQTPRPGKIKGHKGGRIDRSCQESKLSNAQLTPEVVRGTTECTTLIQAQMLKQEKEEI